MMDEFRGLNDSLFSSLKRRQRKKEKRIVSQRETIFGRHEGWSLTFLEIERKKIDGERKKYHRSVTIRDPYLK